MAELTSDGDTVRLSLTSTEKVAALRGDVELRRDQIAGVATHDRPFEAVRGIRAPGVGLPRVVAIGRWRHRDGTDLVVLRRGQRGVVVDLAEGAPYRRLVIGVDDPDAVVAALSA